MQSETGLVGGGDHPQIHRHSPPTDFPGGTPRHTGGSARGGGAGRPPQPAAPGWYSAPDRRGSRRGWAPWREAIQPPLVGNYPLPYLAKAPPPQLANLGAPIGQMQLGGELEGGGGRRPPPHNFNLCKIGLLWEWLDWS